MKKILFLFLILIFILGCNTSYLPFKSRKEKKQSEKLIKNSFDFSNYQHKRITQNDSISYTLSNLIRNKKVAKSKIKKRLDSFLLNKYDQKKLWVILQLDQAFPNMDFNFEKEDGKKRFNFSNVKDLKKFMDQIDSVLVINIRVKNDSLIRMKNKKKQN
ncbi:hypothetical protein [Kordia jejudonensis]|uniref:hypothetical protein n=1 Tax=Kordia jejudonensis TaxID=1348245 RepID=UPI000628FCFE|nr:hypothetical protein [Kordia jejudonensis]